MNTTPHTTLLALLFVLSPALFPACLLEPFTGADVVFEIGSGTFAQGAIANRRNQHYELFAVEDDGLVSLLKFSIDDQLDARTYPDGEKIGVANKTSSGLPESGIAFKTEVNLSDTHTILLSIEPNGESNVAPNTVIARAELTPEADSPSVLKGDFIGSVPTIGGGSQDLEDSRVAIILNEDHAAF